METCDECGAEFSIEDDCYIGSVNGPEDTECSPFMAIVCLCPACAVKRGFAEPKGD